MLHAHVGFWTLALIFFVVSYVLLVINNEKGQKITHMILRLLYILVFGTGLYLVISLGILYSSYWFPLILKGLSGILLLSMMEMILVNGKKGKKAGIYWVGLIIALGLVFYLGYGVLNIG